MAESTCAIVAATQPLAAEGIRLSQDGLKCMKDQLGVDEFLGSKQDFLKTFLDVSNPTRRRVRVDVLHQTFYFIRNASICMLTDLLSITIVICNLLPIRMNVGQQSALQSFAQRVDGVMFDVDVPGRLPAQQLWPPMH